MAFLKEILGTKEGKIQLAVLAGFVLVSLFVLAFSFGKNDFITPTNVSADTATSSVTVLNTPPQWTADAQERFESSSSTPTNVASSSQWIATGTDSNAESYFLLICKTSVAPTAYSNGPPQCDGGFTNMWARSGTTTSGTQALAATTTYPDLGEENDWYAFVCDANVTLPRCHTDYKQGDFPYESPWVLNHRPSFTIFSDSSPANPGADFLMMATSSDSDVSDTNDTVQLIVCREADFDGTNCGSGGRWCTSSFSASDPECTASTTVPTQDKNYTAYGYVIDNHGLAASGGAYETDSVVTVNNLAPILSSTDIQLLNYDGTSDDLALVNEATQTPRFRVRVLVTDNNSCLNASSGDEITSISINVYRSDIGQANCQTVDDFNENYCYTQTVPITRWNVSSTSQETSSCTGSGDSAAWWVREFPLWFLADPTDVGSQYPAETWKASVYATDDNATSSPLTEIDAGKDLTSFLSQDLVTTEISYGSFEPGQGNSNLIRNATTSATGNVGIDVNLSGTDMSTFYPWIPGGATNTIMVFEEQYSTSTVAYDDPAPDGARALSSTTPTLLDLNVFKTTSTTTPERGTTFWGILVPTVITLAGDYTGVNTFTAVTSDQSQW
ncbi:MAG: hypothetical protein A2934_05550 [Candidatus Sungbacteria bacterium RIFCSPLOWO2_01_FULL_47_10]|uniref:Uncharacterized protein n=1 Tax=Candidatus Sungbacteria bacterium RIFCSPLOWO2_01_FULL_47_10 TaxID=1802276 RepID=A0A1G2L5V8_9BACT|nr:MAG: hypothetical protein A2934_05550 [Candidatus Sungbacteria bacterium RIFCSPLOWO2_01_FULL_47_10]